MQITRKDGVKNLLNNDGGILAVLKIALPLILSSSCHAVNMFVDRLMLARYSQAACAASMTSGLTNFTISCIFVGTVGYAGTFVAQYVGANRAQRAGCSVWQAIFVALTGGVILALTGYFFTDRIFGWFGHDPAVVEQEAAYFRILCFGAWSFLLPQALSCFWSGRGKTGMILGNSIFMTVLNVPFNYMLIYGKFGCPELGVAGAAWGTVFSSICGMLVYGFCFFGLRANRVRFGTCRDIFDWELFLRLIRYGFPSGLQLFLDIATFTIFAILLGRYGVTVQEATSISFGINNVAFCPVMGIGQTAAIMVGQAIGAKNIAYARKSMSSCRNLMIVYMVFCGFLYFFGQNVLLAPFIRVNDPSQAEVLRLAGLMLKIIAAYLIFDGTVIIYTSAVKGAGDTRYIMWLTIIMSWGAFAIPCLIAYRLGASFWCLWGIMVGYVVVFAILSYLRYRSGKWTRMQVIETVPPLK